jgi:hypothetical protein
MASLGSGLRQWKKKMMMNARWIGRILRGVRAGERHSASNHAALFGVPEMISLKSEWFLNGKQMPLRSAGIGVGENISPPLSWSGVPGGTVELAIIMEDRDDHSAISEGRMPIARTTHLRILTTVARLSVRRGLRGSLRSFLATVAMPFPQTSDVSDNPVCPGVNCKHES